MRKDRALHKPGIRMKYYITTAIAYTSKKPHIGNSYEIVLTDAIARFRRLQGYDVYFCTGTDEHGQKIEELAKAEGVTPKEHVDRVAGEIRAICDLLNTTYDRFIRTTDADHEAAVQSIFKRLYDKGDIYKGEYEGNYCVPCESFFTDAQLKDGKCPDCGRPVTRAKEEAYFFRLSKYQRQLEEYIESHPDFIYPEARKNEMLNNFIRPGLQDLCVSRTSFRWGIPVPFDDRHVIYVWIDALSNYITALGYRADGSSDLYKKYWPADVHIVGKDIVRFHTIYWPIMLMALGEPLPKKVYGHPWLLFGEDKMSKSKGNVIYADELVERFGTDAVRYYLLSEMPHASDGSISYAEMIDRFNSDLANTLGNLVNRTVAMTNQYFGGILPCRSEADDAVDLPFKRDIEAVLPAEAAAFDAFKIADALEAVIGGAKRSNKYIDETQPWALAKDPEKKARLSTVLYNLIEAIRIIAVELSPFMPETTDRILAQIGTDLKSYESIQRFGGLEPGFRVGEAQPLFVRINAPQLLKEIEAEMREKTRAAKCAAQIAGVAKIGVDDFAKVDLRVAGIMTAERVKGAKKLLKLTLDLGSETRTVVSGIAKQYKPEELIGRRVIMVSNLQPAVIGKIESQGMILAADAGEDDVRLIFADGIPLGSQVK